MVELQDWYHAALTEDQLSQIKAKRESLGFGGGIANVHKEDYINHLQSVAGWFIKNIEVAEVLLNKAESLLLTGEYTSLDAHFLYSETVRIYYRNRAVADYRQKAVAACMKQIKIAPQAIPEFSKGMWAKLEYLPSHKGYQQLAIILEKDKRYSEAIALCTKADREGWNGDWEHRVERCQKKMKKLMTSK